MCTLTGKEEGRCKIHKNGGENCKQSSTPCIHLKGMSRLLCPCECIREACMPNEEQERRRCSHTKVQIESLWLATGRGREKGSLFFFPPLSLSPFSALIYHKRNHLSACPTISPYSHPKCTYDGGDGDKNYRGVRVLCTLPSLALSLPTSLL